MEMWKMKIIIKLGFMFFAFTGSNAMAEGRCPPGYLPSSQFENTGCQPIYDPNQGQSQTTAPKGYWVDSYASLVWGYGKNGSSNYAYGAKYDSQIKADNGALSNCISAGNSDCRVVLQFSNGYLVITSDENGTLYAASEFEKNVAEDKAIQNCMSHNVKGCKIVESVNSRAVWVD